MVRHATTKTSSLLHFVLIIAVIGKYGIAIWGVTKRLNQFPVLVWGQCAACGPGRCDLLRDYNLRDQLSCPLLVATILGRCSIRHTHGSRRNVTKGLRLALFLLIMLVQRATALRVGSLVLRCACGTPRLHIHILIVVIALGRNSVGHLRVPKSLRLALLLLLLLLSDEFMEPGVREGIGGADSELRSQL